MEKKASAEKAVREIRRKTRRRFSAATPRVRNPSSIVSPRSFMRPIAITAPATAPQTAAVLPIPPAKPSNRNSER